MREVSVGHQLPGEAFESYVKRSLVQIAEASGEGDAAIIADAYTIGEFTPTRTLSPATATVSDVANVLATFLDDLQRRGSSRDQ